jgi:Ni/Fe-hydrogenase subunit HybB-like protein
MVGQKPVGGRLFSPLFLTLLAIFLVSLPLIVWRFAAGLGAVTALSDGYPWGIWIAFDVVTGTALASGGFAVALLVFIMNRWRYHPLVRPAMLTSALGYTIAIVSLIVDVGRPWNFWKVPFFLGDWNFDSALLEVALCIAAYTVVLWLEVGPMFLEKWEATRLAWLKRLAERSLRLLYRIIPALIAVGLLLPTMHQSSLGSLMVLAGHKLHPLWQTPLLPLMFLISSFVMGLYAVILESTLASSHFGRPHEKYMLARLARTGMVALIALAGLRLVDLAGRGQLGHAFAPNGSALLLWIEMAAFLLPVAMLWKRSRRLDPGQLMRAAAVALAAGMLYRFDTFLFQFSPGPGYSYFPSLPELLITFGLVALEIMAYLYLVRRFPVLAGNASAARRQS